MTSTTSAIAVIGLGAMGGRAAAALAARHRVYGYDPSVVARDRAAGAGVVVTDQPADAVQDVEVLLLSLPTPAVVRSLVTDLGDAVQGRLVADLSTIDPGTAREVAEVIEHRGGRYLDAPILGRPEGCGAWTLVAGGAEQDIARLSDVTVGVIARSVERVGDVGAGCTLKLLNNLMFGAINTVTAEVMALAEKAGIDLSRFTEIIQHSGAATVSPLFGSTAGKIAAGDFEPTFSIGLLAKDIRLGRQLAESVDGSAPMAELVTKITERAVADGLGDQDTAAVIEVYRRDRPTT